MNPAQQRPSNAALVALAIAASLIARSTPGAQPPELTIAAPRGVVRFAVAGDTGHGSAELVKAIAALHARQPLDGVILTGDNFYPCGPRTLNDPTWDRAVRPLTTLGIPLLPVLGNHDHCGGGDPDLQVRASATIPQWTFPAREYAVRTPFADLAMIDTTPFVYGRATATIIGDVLNASAKPWQIVVGHHTIVSSGWHGYFPRAEVLRMRELLPAMLDAGVDLYICGHDHHVELIRGKVLYLVSGAGSDPIPPIRLHVRTLFPPEITRERIGFAVLELSWRELAIRFHDRNGNARSERFTWKAAAKRSQ